MFDEEITESSYAHDSFKQAVEGQVHKSQERFEQPPFKMVTEHMDLVIQDARKLARKLAKNKIVGLIPMVSPVINAGLDMQKASMALISGKDADTGAVLSPADRAHVAVASFGSSMWEQAKAGVDLAFLAAGGTIVEKMGLQGAGVLVRKGAQLVAHDTLTHGGDRLVYGKEGRKIKLSPGDPKVATAEHIVAGMPGMYAEAANRMKEPDAKKLLLDSSALFALINENHGTRDAFVASLATSENIDVLMAKMQEKPAVSPRVS